MTVKRVLLIRHGETSWNTERRWQGTIHHVPLSDTGLTQAQALADFLTSQPIGSIFSSDLQRAWETAVIIGKTIGIEPQPDARLREVNAGMFQGLTSAELEAKYPRELAELRAGDADYRFPKGESWPEVKARVFKAFTEITQTAQGPQVVMISHGGVIRELLERLFPEAASQLAKAHLPNTSISTVAWDKQRWQLIDVGSTPHLTDFLPPSQNHKRETPL